MLRIATFVAALSYASLGCAEPLVLSANNTIALTTEVNSESVTLVERQLIESNYSAALPVDAPVNLVLYTPGGDVVAGLELIDFAKSIKRPINTIVVQAASMGFAIAQIGKTRFIRDSGIMMDHKGQVKFSGESPQGTANVRLKFMDDLIWRVFDGISERTGKRYSAQQLANMMDNEYYCVGAKCVAEGFADKVVTPMCDQTLSKTEKIETTIYFLGIPISLKYKQSKCPLIPEITDVEVSMREPNLELSDDMSFQRRLHDHINATLGGHIIDFNVKK